MLARAAAFTCSFYASFVSFILYSSLLEQPDLYKRGRVDALADAGAILEGAGLAVPVDAEQREQPSRSTMQPRQVQRGRVGTETDTRAEKALDC